jgi:hypothetical protein
MVVLDPNPVDFHLSEEDKAKRYMVKTYYLLRLSDSHDSPSASRYIPEDFF